MEQLKMPMRDVYATYTKSELAILAWRSLELAYNYDTNAPGMEDVEKKLEPISKKLFDKKGEVDLRQLTAEEFSQYFAAISEATEKP